MPRDLHTHFNKTRSIPKPKTTEKIEEEESKSACYWEEWEAIVDRKIYQYCKYDFENPHRAAKNSWPDLRGKRFTVKFHKKYLIESKFSRRNYNMAKKIHNTHLKQRGKN